MPGIKEITKCEKTTEDRTELQRNLRRVQRGAEAGESEVRKEMFRESSTIHQSPSTLATEFDNKRLLVTFWNTGGGGAESVLPI